MNIDRVCRIVHIVQAACLVLQYTSRQEDLRFHGRPVAATWNWSISHPTRFPHHVCHARPQPSVSHLLTALSRARQARASRPLLYKSLLSLRSFAFERPQTAISSSDLNHERHFRHQHGILRLQRPRRLPIPRRAAPRPLLRNHKSRQCMQAPSQDL